MKKPALITVFVSAAFLLFTSCSNLFQALGIENFAPVPVSVTPRPQGPSVSGKLAPGTYTVTANIWFDRATTGLPLNPHLTNSAFPPMNPVSDNATLRVETDGHAYVSARHLCGRKPLAELLHLTPRPAHIACCTTARTLVS